MGAVAQCGRSSCQVLCCGAALLNSRTTALTLRLAQHVNKQQKKGPQHRALWPRAPGHAAGRRQGRRRRLRGDAQRQGQLPRQPRALPGCVRRRGAGMTKRRRRGRKRRNEGGGQRTRCPSTPHSQRDNVAHPPLFIIITATSRPQTHICMITRPRRVRAVPPRDDAGRRRAADRQPGRAGRRDRHTARR